MLSEGSTFVPITDHSFSCREGGDHMLAFSNNTGEPVGRGKTPPPQPTPPSVYCLSESSVLSDENVPLCSRGFKWVKQRDISQTTTGK